MVRTDIVSEIIDRLPKNPILLGRIGRAVRQHPKGAPIAEAYFRYSVARFSKDAPLRNQLASVLVESGRPDKREEALRLLRETIQFSKDSYSRNQLARVLGVSSDPAERKEAISILEAAIQDPDTDSTYSLKLLEELRNPPAGALPDEVDEGRVLQEESERDSGVHGGIGQYPPPANVTSLARMRRLGFRLKHGAAGVREVALQELQAIFRSDPTFAYAQLLAARQKLWNELGDVSPSFPAAFEMALQSEDLDALARLRKVYPQFESLIFVARALFGDSDATSRVESLLNERDYVPFGIDYSLRTRLRTVSKASGDTSAVAILSRFAPSVLAALRDASEAIIGGDDGRIAA
jgi:tetratricopeptide (TPR) repeat protein